MAERCDQVVIGVGSAYQRNRGRVALTTGPTASGVEVRMHAEPTHDRQPLRRLDPGYDGSRYLHPHGYVIERERRTWSERGREPGRHHDPPPRLYWWTVWHHIARRRSMLADARRPDAFAGVVSDSHHPKDFDTLREARAWCDENPREGWVK